MSFSLQFRNQIRPSQLFSTFLLTLLCSCLIVPAAFADLDLNLPAPTKVKPISRPMQPVTLKAVTVDPKDPFLFDFLVDKGDTGLEGEALEAETQTLVKYFLAALTIPESDLWVNLSPYEKDAMVPQALGITELGKDLLVDDYMLKQVTAGLTNPNTETGKKFWDTAYARAQEMFGTTKVPINTFSKVWIVPDQAVVLEKDGSAFIADSHLKVFLDEDYLAVKNNLNNKEIGTDKIGADKTERINKLSSQLIKEIVLPVIEKEVNTGENFAKVRQVYSSAILAAWYKKRLKESILGQLYADKNKVAGVNNDDFTTGDQIFAKYTAALKTGVYNIIKQDYDLSSQKTLQRKYFSGGVKMSPSASTSVREMTPQAVASLSPVASQALTRAITSINAGSASSSLQGSNFSMVKVRVAAPSFSTIQSVAKEVNRESNPFVEILSQSSSAVSSGVMGANANPATIRMLAYGGFRSLTPEKIQAVLERNTIPPEQAGKIATAITAMRNNNQISAGTLNPTDLMRIMQKIDPSIDVPSAIKAFDSKMMQGMATAQIDTYRERETTVHALTYAEQPSISQAYQAAGFTPEQSDAFAKETTAIRSKNPAAFNNTNSFQTAATPELADAFSQSVSNPSFTQSFRQSSPTSPFDNDQETAQWRTVTTIAPTNEVVELIRQQATATLKMSDDQAKQLASDFVELRERNPQAMRNIQAVATEKPVLAQALTDLGNKNVFVALTSKYVTPTSALVQVDAKALTDAMISIVPEKARKDFKANVIETQLTAARNSPVVLSGIFNKPEDYSKDRKYGALAKLVAQPQVKELVTMLSGNNASSAVAPIQNIMASIKVANPDAVANVEPGDKLTEYFTGVTNKTSRPSERRFEPVALTRTFRAIAYEASQNQSFSQRVAGAANVQELQSIVQAYVTANPSSQFARNISMGDLAKVSNDDLKTVGGIDLSADKMGLQIKRDGNGVPLAFPMQDVGNLKIDGLSPVILDVKPATPQNTPFLMNLVTGNKN